MKPTDAEARAAIAALKNGGASGINAHMHIRTLIEWADPKLKPKRKRRK